MQGEDAVFIFFYQSETVDCSTESIGNMRHVSSKKDVHPCIHNAVNNFKRNIYLRREHYYAE